MSGRIRIALLITELEVGGAERALTNLAVGLDPQEFAVTVYSLDRRPMPGQLELVERLEQAGIAVEFIQNLPAWMGGWWLISMFRQLRQLLRRDRPQVLLSFLYHANVMGGAAITFFNDAPVHIASVRVAEPRRKRLLYERFFLRVAAKVTCVSEMLREYVVEHQHLAPAKVAVIPNGVEVEPFATAEPADLTSLGIGQERKLLTAIGRLEHQKGFDWLLLGIDTLLEQLPEHDLLIVGEGPLRSDLEKQIASCATAERIHLIGRRSDVPAILKRSKLFLLPSRYEGMPNVLLEAMAAGLPVVARDVEGVADLLGPHSELQLAPFGDATTFCHAVYELAINTQAMHELGNANRQRVEQHFSVAQMVSAYANLLRNASNSNEKKS